MLNDLFRELPVSWWIDFVYACTEDSNRRLTRVERAAVSSAVDADSKSAGNSQARLRKRARKGASIFHPCGRWITAANDRELRVGQPCFLAGDKQ